MLLALNGCMTIACTQVPVVDGGQLLVEPPYMQYVSQLPAQCLYGVGAMPDLCAAGSSSSRPRPGSS